MHLRHRSGRPGRRLRRGHGRPADRLLRLEPQRRRRGRRARHGRAPRRARAADRRRSAAHRISTSRPPTTSRSPGAAARSSRATTRTTSARRRSTSWSSSSPTCRGRRRFSITALGGAIGRVPEDATAYAGRAAAFDLSADSSWTDPALDDANIDWCRRAMADRRARPDARRLRERQRRRRPRGDPPDLRRREARPPRRPEADLGPRQRVPREPQRGAGLVERPPSAGTNAADEIRAGTRATRILLTESDRDAGPKASRPAQRWPSSARQPSSVMPLCGSARGFAASSSCWQAAFLTGSLPVPSPTTRSRPGRCAPDDPHPRIGPRPGRGQPAR